MLALAWCIRRRRPSEVFCLLRRWLALVKIKHATRRAGCRKHSPHAKCVTCEGLRFISPRGVKRARND